jgi:hypothetical protein
VGTKTYGCWNKSILMGKKLWLEKQIIGCGNKTYDWENKPIGCGNKNLGMWEQIYGCGNKKYGCGNKNIWLLEQTPRYVGTKNLWLLEQNYFYGDKFMVGETKS